MLEKIAGRLKCENADQGIRVEIPARWGSSEILCAASLVSWAVTDGIYEWSNLPDGGLFRLATINIVLAGVGAWVILAWACWSLTGRTFVTLNPNELKIQRRVLGVEWDTRRFATPDVRNLRYLPPTEMWLFRTDTDPNTSKIQIQVKNKTVRFARGITEREACALFDRMEEIYKFPKDSELDQVATVR